jgi:hypothetical protein
MSDDQTGHGRVRALLSPARAAPPQALPTPHRVAVCLRHSMTMTRSPDSQERVSYGSARSMAARMHHPEMLVFRGK